MPIGHLEPFQRRLKSSNGDMRGIKPSLHIRNGSTNGVTGQTIHIQSQKPRRRELSLRRADVSVNIQFVPGMFFRPPPPQIVLFLHFHPGPTPPPLFLSSCRWNSRVRNCCIVEKENGKLEPTCISNSKPWNHCTKWPLFQEMAVKRFILLTPSFTALSP